MHGVFSRRNSENHYEVVCLQSPALLPVSSCVPLQQLDFHLTAVRSEGCDRISTRSAFSLCSSALRTPSGIRVTTPPIELAQCLSHLQALLETSAQLVAI